MLKRRTLIASLLASAASPVLPVVPMVDAKNVAAGFTLEQLLRARAKLMENQITLITPPPYICRREWFDLKDFKC